MRNVVLTKEIIKHIFRSFGITFGSNNQINIYNLLDKEFLLDKKLSFETENKNKFENNIWCVSSKIEKSEIKIVIADLRENLEEQEYAMIVQLDKLTPFGLRISNDEEDDGDLHLNVDGKWVNTNIFLQSKLLNGIEGLSELFLHWEKIKNYNEMYNSLIDYLKFLQ